MAASPEDPQEELVAELVREVRRFAAREVDSGAIERAGCLPPGLIARAAEMGLYGITVPEAHGGLGLSLAGAGAIIEEIAAADRSLAISIGLHAGLGTRAIVELAAPALKDEWLPRMARGCVGAFAATEAGAGSDLGAIRTTARVVGDELELEGEKAYVTNGGFAGVFTVLARTPADGPHACSLILVPAKTEGISIGAEEDKLGIRASSTVTVQFAGVRVPRSHVLGPPGRGADHAHNALAWGRTLMSAGCVGTARAALEATLGHVTTRRQFGRSIGEFPATRAHVARMAARLFAMRALVASAASSIDRIDRGANGGHEGTPAQQQTAMAKVFCSEGAFEICDRAVQLHGALGFIEPIGVARMLRDCRITRIFEGANDVLLVHLGAARLATREPRAVVPVADPELAGAAGLRDTLAARLATEVKALQSAYGVAAVRRQTLLQRIALADIALEAASASLSHAGRARGQATSGGADRELARFAVSQLVREGMRHLDELAADTAAEEPALALTTRLYAPFSDSRDSRTRAHPTGAVS